MADDGHVFDNPELQVLEDRYGAGYVITAFNVQDKIREEGIEGIQFMAKTENHLKQIAPPIAHQKVKKNIRNQLRQQGL